jgi:hypothetical protein
MRETYPVTAAVTNALSGYLQATSSMPGQIILTGANSYKGDYLVQSPLPGSGPYLLVYSAGVYEGGEKGAVPGNPNVFGVWPSEALQCIDNQGLGSTLGWYYQHFTATFDQEIVTLTMVPLSAKQCSCAFRWHLVSA